MPQLKPEKKTQNGGWLDLTPRMDQGYYVFSSHTYNHH